VPHQKKSGRVPNLRLLAGHHLWCQMPAQHAEAFFTVFKKEKNPKKLN